MLSETTKNAVREELAGESGNAMAIEAAAQFLQDACHRAALDAGWWPIGSTSGPSNPLHFSNKLCLIHSEISEAMEADRKHLNDSHLPNRPGREVELADALIRIFDLARGYDMDLAGALVEKLAYNRERLDHKAGARAAEHGKKY